MPSFAYDTLTRVDWVVTLSSTTSPTATQLNAGTNVSTFVTKDGVALSLSPNFVDNAPITSTTDSQNVGTQGASLTLKGIRKNSPDADTFWLLMTYGTVGFVVIRYGILFSTAYAAAQPVIVVPAQMHKPAQDPSAANAMVTFSAPFAVTGEVQEKAIVA